MRSSLLHRIVLIKLVITSASMFAFGYALVPFYRHICLALGLNNIQSADAVENTQVDTGRIVAVEFDHNRRGDARWEFKPLVKGVRLHPGQLQTVEYEVVNRTARPIVVQAVPSFAPQQAGAYFKKLDCFCFTQQKLAAGEMRKMPVVFLLDRHLPPSIDRITLSYTFFEVEGGDR